MLWQPWPNVSEWSGNGVPGGGSVTGTVIATRATATFTEPAVKPNPDTVAVSARVDRGAQGKSLLTSNITIVDDTPIPVSWTGTASGTQTSDAIVETSTAALTWTLNSVVNNVAVCRPTGGVSDRAPVPMPGRAFPATPLQVLRPVRK